MPLPVQTYSTIEQLINYINTYFIPNANNEIDGEEGNNILNGLANFIVRYTVNSSLAGISSSTGIVPLSKPITVFTVTPASVNWPDNIQNEYYIVNATPNNIPLTSGYSYVDQYGTSLAIIPARTSIHIAKATSGAWIQINNVGGGAGSLPPQTGHPGETLTTNGTSAYWASPLIHITSADFETDGVTYINTSLVSNKLDIFWDDLPNFIYEGIHWEYEAGGGFNITIPGFDANAFDYNLHLFLKGLNS